MSTHPSPPFPAASVEMRPVRPTFFQKAFWEIMRVVYRFTFRIATRAHATHRERIPRKGPFLFMGNHQTFLDPFILAYFVPVTVHYMASAHWFRRPFFRFGLELFSTIPKAKFTKDPSAMQALQQWYDAGEVVGIFPEGRRSWDGRPWKVLPRTGRLVKRLNAPVVFGRILNGVHFHPRWAVWPRFVAVHVDYSGLVHFPPEMTEEEIDAEIQRHIAVRPEEVPRPRWAFGFRMAVGLPNWLWACPHCFAMEALEVPRSDRNSVRCRACGAAWRVDVEQNLHPVAGGAEPLTVPDANQRIVDHHGTPPIQDRATYEACGEVLSGEDARVSRVGDRASPPLRGRLVLTPTALSLRTPTETAWELRLTDVIAVSIENIGILQVRGPEGLLQIDVPGRSVCRWQHFLNGWRDQPGT